MRPGVPTTLRLMAVTMAVFVVAMASAGWWISIGIKRINDGVTVWMAALDTADQTVESATRVAAAVEEGLAAAHRLGPEVSSSSTLAAGLIDDVATITGVQLADSVGAIELALPALIDAAAVMDDTLRALSFVGVRYEPQVPLDDGLRGLQTGVAGLSQELAAQGRSLALLGAEVGAVADEIEVITTTVAATRDELAAATELLDGYREVLSQARATVGSARWGAAVAAIRVLVVVAGLAGLAMAGTAWRLADEMVAMPGWSVWSGQPGVLGISTTRRTPMTTTVRDLMTPDPRTVTSDQVLVDAARLMRDHDVGSLIVMKREGGICGIVTDRDIAVRAVAEGMDVTRTPVDRACSHSLHTVSPDASGDDVVILMRRHALRRIPVVEGDKPVGIISLGDLAIQRDPDSALGDISAAPPNN